MKLLEHLLRPLAEARAADLRTAVAKARSAWLDSLVGESQRVLTETDGTGYAENFARVAVPEGTAPGTIVSVTPTAVEEGLLK